MAIRLRGVLQSPRSLAALLLGGDTDDLPDEIVGRSFISTRFESSKTKYRWLVASQLLGFGEARAWREGTGATASRKLAISYDLYSAT
jgi:hypothetical protein